MNNGLRDTNALSRGVTTVAFPVHWAVDKLHRYIPAARFSHSRKIWHCLVGLALMLLGAWMADALGIYLGTLLANTLGYAIHGLGLAPIAKVIEEALILD